MKITSARAAKLIKSYQSELTDLRVREDKTSTFVVSIEENPEDARPYYSFEENRKAEEELTKKIRKLKHALNVFNTTTVIPGFGITIDEALVLMPQLKSAADRLDKMKSALPKERIAAYSLRSTQSVEYRYANYDIAAANEEFQNTAGRLASLQLALDNVNNTVEFEVDI